MFKPTHRAMTNSLTLLTTRMRMRVNTLPPYQHCLIDTRHLKHAEQLPDVPWYNEAIENAKRERKKAERK